jgi:hypothetical protein
MNQDTYDIIEVIGLAVGCLVSVVTLRYMIAYTRSTFSIAQSAQDTALEAEETAKTTERALDISSKILEEMRETRDAQTAPYVYVYFDQMRGEDAAKIYLVVKNAGKGLARDVRIAFDPELQNDSTFSLEHIQQLTKYIPFLPPEGMIRHPFIFTVDYWNSQPPHPLRYKVCISYYGGIKDGQRIVEQVISFDFFQGSRLNRLEERDH